MRKINSIAITCAIAGIFTLSSFISSAAIEAEENINLRHAINEFKQENYAEAYEQFLQYLPLGSPDAAYYLAYSNIDELGTEYNPIQALAYFQLANEWGHPTASEYVVQIEPHLTAAEITAANDFAALVKSKLVVPHSSAFFEITDEPLPKRLNARPPRYPREMSVAGIQSWLIMAHIVGPNGRVIFSTPLNSTLRDTMKNYLRIEDQWRYEERESFSFMTLQLDFNMDMSKSDDLKIVKKTFDDVYPLAMIGVPEHLMFLSDLSRRENQHEQEYEFMQNISAVALMERAARGGYIHAQRSLALRWRREVWAEYLINRGDLTTMTLYGALLHGRAKDPQLVKRGAALIKTAADAGYENAAALLPYLPNTEE